jgi:hypothetical protein
MKARKTCFLLGSMLIFILFTAGCTQTTVNPKISSSPTQTLLVNTVTPTHTLTPVPTVTPTAIPSLPVEAARARLLDLLVNNGNCRLPCLWGITPGRSTYQDAQGILAPLASISDLTFTSLLSSPGTIDLVYAKGDSEILADIQFLYGNDGIVSHIAFQARELKEVAAPGGGRMSQGIFDSKTFGQQVHAYRLPQVLSELGIPAAVLLQTSGALAKYSPGFEIVLFYPDQGLLVHYTTQMQIVGKKVHGCPASAHVELELYPSGHPESFSKYLAPTQWASLWPVPTFENPFWKPVEKATSMSLEQFYETFRQPTDQCIETPLQGWYVPNQ